MALPWAAMRAAAKQMDMLCRTPITYLRAPFSTVRHSLYSTPAEPITYTPITTDATGKPLRAGLRELKGPALKTIFGEAVSADLTLWIRAALLPSPVEIDGPGRDRMTRDRIRSDGQEFSITKAVSLGRDDGADSLWIVAALSKLLNEAAS